MIMVTITMSSDPQTGLNITGNVTGNIKQKLL